MAASDLGAQIDAIMSRYIKPDMPGAAVAVVKNGRTAHRKGYGLANLEWNIPVKPDTVFRLGSITKQFTAIAIMMLQEQGKLNVTDSVSKYIPDYPLSGHAVTIHHLLTHTSGIKSYTSLPDFFELAKKKRTPQEILDLVKEKPFDFAPGAKWSYNNSGYNLLGMIIEKISGMSYADFMQQQIFTPLEMKQTYYLDNEPIVPKRASGYDENENGFTNAQYIDMSFPYASGSIGSTVNDLILWDRAIYKNKLIKARTRSKMWQPVKLNDGSTEPYGYGWAIGAYRGHHAIHHGGGIHGFTTNMLRFPADNAMIVVLCNHFNDTLKIMLDISRRVLDLPDVERKPARLTDAIVKKVSGKYLLGTFPSEIIKTDDKLILKTWRESQLLPVNATTFYPADYPEFEYVFSDEQDGKYTRLTGKDPIGEELRFTRAPD